MSTIIPSIKEKDGVIYDPYSLLLKNRIIMVEGEINSNMANSIIAQLLLLEHQGTEPIAMYINSPGGEIAAGLAIADTMEFINCDVITIGIGMQASMGSFLLASGAQGKRYALKRSSIMIHRLSGGTQGDYHSMESNFDHLKRLHQDLLDDYVRLSGGKKTKEEFEELMRYDNWLTLDEAKEYGLIDHIIYDRKSFASLLEGSDVNA